MDTQQDENIEEVKVRSPQGIMGTMNKLLPISNWIPNYSTQKGIGDLIAGITVGLTLIPQSIAYAGLAGLSPEFGLYSSLIGGITYAVFGTITELNIAPTALISLLTFSYTHQYPFGPVVGAILLCFVSGIVEIICGACRLGFLVDFVSTPVVAGFTSAGALTIAGSQIKSLLGLHFQAESFMKTIYNVFVHISETKMWDALLSLGCCIFLISFREIKRFGAPPTFGETTEKRQTFRTVVWFLSVARNAIVVIFCAFMAYLLHENGYAPFSLTGRVPEGLPKFILPFDPVVNNATVEWDFFNAITELGSGIIIVPFISILSNIAIAKSFAKGQVLDATQEMLAIGFCNLFGSFFGSFPVSASFSRAAVNNSSGARTPFGGIYAGILVILSLTFLTPYFAYIPKPTLSSVIFCAVLYMVEITLTKLVWRINRIDFFPLGVTLIACLSLSIEVGIIIGIIVDLLLVLYFSARPKIDVDNIKHSGDFHYLRVTFVGYLFYTAAEYARDRVVKEFSELSIKPKYVIFDCSKLRKLDFTSAKCLEALINDLQRLNAKIAFMQLKSNLEEIIENLAPNACAFLHSYEEVERFFEEKEMWHFNIQHTNANVNEAFQPDGIELK